MNKRARTAQRQTILVVDDTPENLDILKGALKQNYLVRIATRGKTALDIAHRMPPDLILLDIMMPEMDGYSVMERLQADPRTRDIPVIFVSALTEVGDELRGLSLGARDYITKPFSIPLVLARIRTHLTLRDAQRALIERNRQLQSERDLIDETLTLLREAADFDARHLRWLSSSVDKSNGDVLMSSHTPNGSQWVMVGDVAGHGPLAALGIPLVADVFYRHAKSATTATEMLSALNAVMYDRLPPQIYMPYVLAEIDSSRSSIKVWNGGLPGCALLEADGQVTRIGPTTIALGLVGQLDTFPMVPETLAVTRCARFFAFTDGVTELHDTAGEFVGADRVLEFLAATPPEADFGLLLEKLAQLTGLNREYPDDMTILEVSLGAS